MQSTPNQRPSSASEYDVFRLFLQEECGIHLGDNKQYLVSSRLNPLMSEHNLNSLDDLIQRIRQQRDHGLKELVIDAMTTNETQWFRDGYPFDYLSKTLFPSMKQNSASGTIRIWSAACSSGQEPYSIAMAFEEFRQQTGDTRMRLQVVATDLSSSMLDRARSGCYDSLALGRGLSPQRKQKFFSQQDNNFWKVNDDVQRHVDFRSFNLLSDYRSLGMFDMIFCRNVLIYFAVDLKSHILKRIHQSLSPRGYLFLGAAESLSSAAENFDMIQCQPGIVYRAK